MTDLKVTNLDQGIIGFRFRLQIVKLNGLSQDGVPLLDDFRRIEESYGVADTYSTYRRYHEIEQYKIFLKE